MTCRMLHAGAFSIAQEQGRRHAFTDAVAAKTLILNKCIPVGQEGLVVGWGPTNARAARSFGDSIKEARVKATPRLTAMLAFKIVDGAVEDDPADIALSITVSYAWGLAHADSVAIAIETAYTKVCTVQVGVPGRGAHLALPVVWLAATVLYAHAMALVKALKVVGRDCIASLLTVQLWCPHACMHCVQLHWTPHGPRGQPGRQ